jgi:hypothetical protein
MKKKINNRKIKYTNEPMFLGERVFNLLPSPEELMSAEKTQRITLNLTEDTVDFFKERAEKQNYPYQQLIRNVLDKFVDSYRE